MKKKHSMLKGKNVVNQRLSTSKKINNIEAYNFTAEKKCKYFSKKKIKIFLEYMKRLLESAREFKLASSYTGLASDNRKIGLYCSDHV